MDSMHQVEYGNRTIYTTVTSQPATVGSWIHQVNTTSYLTKRSTIIVGLDVEGKTKHRRCATLQLCVGNRCLIVQFKHMRRIPDSLRRFLANPRHVFAGVEVESDAKDLEEDYGLVCGRVYDVRKAGLERSEECFSRCPGLKEMARTVAGVVLEKNKKVTLSNWWKKELSVEQVEYACLDAYASCRVGVILFFDLNWEKVNISALENIVLP